MNKPLERHTPILHKNIPSKANNGRDQRESKEDDYHKYSQLYEIVSDDTTPKLYGNRGIYTRVEELENYILIYYTICCNPSRIR